MQLVQRVVDTVCGRCGTGLDERFRFCPECGLPTSGGAVLSTQIQELRTQAERAANSDPRPEWQRVLLPTAAAGMVVFVLGLGLLIFNRPLLEALVLPETETVVPPPLAAASWEPEWVTMHAGEFLSGPPGAERRVRLNYDFEISRYEIMNELWWEFLQSQEGELRLKGIWSEAVPGESGGWVAQPDGAYQPTKILQRPVRNVSALAVAEFGRWLTRRLGETDRAAHTEIRMPTRYEWEYAARGSENRQYPWGDKFEKAAAPPKSGMDTPPPRIGLVYNDMPYLVHALPDDVTPEGVMGLGTNVQEFVCYVTVFDTDLPRAEDLPRLLEKLAANVYRCGASFGAGNEGRHLARPWYHRDCEPRHVWYNTGVRLVKVRTPADGTNLVEILLEEGDEEGD